MKKAKDDNKALKERDAQLSDELEIVQDALSSYRGCFEIKLITRL